MENFRSVSHVIEPQFVVEGAGVLLRRSIAPRPSAEYDPFLLFDHFAFNNPLQGPIRGFPTHPHRGLETVTYMLEGFVAHRDSLGNQGIIGAGDAQWMTSGRGILHEEMPRRGESGDVYGFQLWVNLPAALKMSPPRYQEIKAEQIPTLEKSGARIRLLAGTLDGAQGPVTDVAASPLYMDVQLFAGGRFVLPVPQGHTVLAYLFEGAAEFSNDYLESVRMIAFHDDGGGVQAYSETGARFLLMTGAPFKEPVVPYGPFVMNTMEEIQQTLRELREGTFIRQAV